MKKKLLINLGLLLIIIILFFLFFEIFLRIIEPKAKYQRENEFIFFEFDEYLGWKNKPYAEDFFSIPDSKSYVQINSKGLRDIEHDYEKKGNITRIQFYGDSFTWGYGVDEEERYASIFRTKLNENFSNKYEVINMGTSGYGTDQEYLLLKREGLKYSPDIVVFAYHNDAFDVAQKFSGGKYPKPSFILINNSLKLTNAPIQENWKETQKRDLGSIIVTIDIKLHFLKTYSFIRKRIYDLKPIVYLRRVLLGAGEDGTLQIINSLLLESNKICKENNATFIILLIPDENQVYGKGNTKEIDYLIDFGRQNNITVINLLPSLKYISQDEKNIYFKIDKHFSKKGNEIVGNLLFNNFLEEGFLDSKN